MQKTKQRLLLLRRHAIVKGERVDLVFLDHARQQRWYVFKSRDGFGLQRWSAVLDRPVLLKTHFRAVTAGRRQEERRKARVDVADGPPADDGQGPVRGAAQRMQILAQARRHINLVRPIRDIEQCSIHVKDQRVTRKIDLWKPIRWRRMPCV